MTGYRNQKLLEFVEETIKTEGQEYATEMMDDWRQCLNEMAAAGINVAAVSQDVGDAKKHLDIVIKPDAEKRPSPIRVNPDLWQEVVPGSGLYTPKGPCLSGRKGLVSTSECV